MIGEAAFWKPICQGDGLAVAGKAGTAKAVGAAATDTVCIRLRSPFLPLPEPSSLARR